MIDTIIIVFVIFCLVHLILSYKELQDLKKEMRKRGIEIPPM